MAIDTDNDGDFTDEICLSDMPATGIDGQDVQWRMEATNIGTGTLDDCTISDPDVPTDCAGFQILQGTSFVCEAPGVCDGSTEGTNTATVTCQICEGRDIVSTDMDTADLVCLTPQIDIRKQEEGPDVRTFPVGADVPFEIEVCNTGDEDLTGVIVTDELGPGL